MTPKSSATAAPRLRKAPQDFAAQCAVVADKHAAAGQEINCGRHRRVRRGRSSSRGAGPEDVQQKRRSLLVGARRAMPASGLSLGGGLQLALCTLLTIIVTSGSMLINDYHDFMRGVDTIKGTHRA